MEQYKKALLLKMKSEATNLMKDKLNNMALQEASILSSLEKNMVNELVRLFLETFNTSKEMKEEALVSSLNELKGEYDKGTDPLFKFFDTSLSQFQTDKTKSSFVDRCNRLFKQKEQEFLDTFTVTSEEYKEVSKLAKLCKSGQGFNLGKLNEVQKDKLNQLYLTLSQKMGYYVPTLSLEPTQYSDPLVNKELSDKLNLVQTTRLEEFLKQFV